VHTRRCLVQVGAAPTDDERRFTAATVTRRHPHTQKIVSIASAVEPVYVKCDDYCCSQGVRSKIGSHCAMLVESRIRLESEASCSATVVFNVSMPFWSVAPASATTTEPQQLGDLLTQRFPFQCLSAIPHWQPKLG